ncbi:MAG: chemotaxis protein CheW [Fusobacteriales bacterium]|jgi:chemotaxis signal transduction protein|nr:chemotaxis protein CheW [Fusobacteriales bacterium]
MKPVKKYLVFEAGKELYGIELKYVLKIKNNAKFYELPSLGKDYPGVIHFDNRFIPVAGFGGVNPGNSEAGAVLILRYRTNEFSIFVKNVFDIYELENMETAEDFYIDGKVVKLINLEEFIGG